MLNHKYRSPVSAMRKGMVYTGNNHRLRRALSTLLSGGHADGRPFKIGVIGGSISWGQGASIRGETDWFSIFSKWVLQAFPKANILLRNGCVPATPASYMTMCLELSSDDDTDIIFAEFSLNDGFAESIMENPIVEAYERLIRRVVGRGPHPPMIMMQVPLHGQAFPLTHHEWQPFHRSLEGLEAELAQYYDLQVLSFRTAVWRLAHHKKEPGFTFEDLMIHEFIHPADKGLRLMADLAVWLFQQTAVDLMLQPFGKRDMELLADPMPPPMVKGNEAPQTCTCAHQDDLKKLVLADASQGFTFVNEGSEEKPKKGYVATTVGSVLVIQVNTWRGGIAPVPVYLAHMRSYQHMGTALVRCTSGCTCPEKIIDAHQSIRASQLYLAIMQASQHRECVVSVTVQPQTTSGEHKFKVGGVMLAEAANGGKRFDIPEGRWLMRYHADSGLQLRITKDNIHNISLGLTPVLVR